jgi:S-adenosylmethionine:tRNA ribosyltransferase-isomerase
MSKIVPQELSIKDYTYHLPQERIAQFPLENRDDAKLLVFENETIQNNQFYELPELLNAGDNLIFNQTRVIHARLHFKTLTGALVEVFILEPNNNIDIQTAMLHTGGSIWICLVGNAKKWKANEKLSQVFKIEEVDCTLEIELIDKVSDGFLIQFQWKPNNASFAEVIEKAGEIPLPPYMKRAPIADDEERYQTVYASEKGSVAAPTAGLHFTERVLKNLQKSNISCEFLTLHVGAGTFKPVKAEVMANHEMHEEEVIVSLDLIENLSNCKGKIGCVGTTSLRSLESIYWTALRLMKNANGSLEISVEQWEPYKYQNEELPNCKEAFRFLVAKMKEAKMKTISGKTAVIIAPGYKIKTCDFLITNFHQPESTLLLLVSAFVGEENWRNIYDFALSNEYRFLSFGDSSLLYRH